MRCVLVLIMSLLSTVPAQGSRDCSQLHIPGITITEMISRYRTLEKVARHRLAMRDQSVMGVELLWAIAQVAQNKRNGSPLDWVSQVKFKKAISYAPQNREMLATLRALIEWNLIQVKDSNGRNWERQYRLSHRGLQALLDILEKSVPPRGGRTKL